MRLISAGLVLLGYAMCFSPLHAQDQATTLAQQLFEDFDDELFSDLTPIEKDETPRQTNDLDRRVRRYLDDEGEGQRRGANRLGQLADTMLQARDRLQDRDLAAATQQIQDGIVRGLDDVIAELKKQPPPNRGGSQSKPPNGQKQEKPDLGKPSNQTGTNPAMNGETQLGNAETTETDDATRDRMMQESWGNLPAAIRQQMQSSRPETFLPKYARLIEEYFKRLSEEKPQR